MHFGGFGGGGMHSVAAASLAVVSAEAWSPAGAYSSPGETALSAHPSPASVSSATDSTTSHSGVTPSSSGTASSSGITISAILCSSVHHSLPATQRTVIIAGGKPGPDTAGNGSMSAMTTATSSSPVPL